VCVESRGSLGEFSFVLCLLLIFRGVHSAVTLGESRFRLHSSGALVMGIKAKLRRDINSPDFSTCLLLIQLVWVAVDLTSYRSMNRVDIKSHNPDTTSRNCSTVSGRCGRRRR